jgi:hypothetical protein
MRRRYEDRSAHAPGDARTQARRRAAPQRPDGTTRDVFDASDLEGRLRQLGAAFYRVEENLDTSNLQALLSFAMHAVIAPAAASRACVTLSRRGSIDVACDAVTVVGLRLHPGGDGGHTRQMLSTP